MTMLPDPLAEPQKIAFAGDWHMNAHWAEQAIAYAATQGANVIVHLGDFGYTFADEFMGRVETALKNAGIPLLFVDGNHEAFPTLRRYPITKNGLRKLSNHVWHLPRGFRWVWGGVRFLALGGAYSVDRKWRVSNVSWWHDETITLEQVTQAISDGAADVLVSHDCPEGVSIPDLHETGHGFPFIDIMCANDHRRTLRTVVDAVKPRMIWHGHYHRHYTALTDFDYGPVLTYGMNCDGTTLGHNVTVARLADIAAYAHSASITERRIPMIEDLNI